MEPQLQMRRLPRVTTRQLWHFVTAAEAGKLAEAGRVLRMAPSAISNSISELEATLGVQLCVRHKAKGIVLTPSGETALAYARNLLSDLHDFERFFNGDEDSGAAPLAVGCYGPLAPLVLPMTHSEFAARHPNARVEFIEEAHGDLQRRLLEGSIDMAFMYNLDLDHRLQRFPISALTASVLLPGDHPLSGPDAPAVVPLQRLADEPFVMFGASPMYEHYIRIFDEEGITPNIAHTCRNIGTVRAFVGRGAGVALSYEKYDLRMTVENLSIVSKPVVSRAAQPLELCIVLARGAKPSVLTREWIDSARHALSERTDTQAV